MGTARLLCALLLLLLGTATATATGTGLPPPRLVLAILARNAQHSLPHCLGALERMDYPAGSIALW